MFSTNCHLLVLKYDVHCKWGKSRSDSFRVLCVTKQGGILSPDFFAIYMDDLIKILRASKIGCHILNLFIACIVFAEDMSLLAPTRGALQELLNICISYCEKFCLNFNVKKTKVVVFGRNSVDSHSVDSLAKLKLGDADIDYVQNFRYLGFNILDSDFLLQNVCGASLAPLVPSFPSCPVPKRMC